MVELPVEHSPRHQLEGGHLVGRRGQQGLGFGHQEIRAQMRHSFKKTRMTGSGKKKLCQNKERTCPTFPCISKFVLVVNDENQC